MADRHQVRCQSAFLFGSGRMPIGEYWTIYISADCGKLMAAIGIKTGPNQSVPIVIDYNIIKK
jgi:hypothetical protein